MDDAKLWEQAVAEAKRMQQQADWQSLRKTGQRAAPLGAASQGGPLQRESWMTDVPEGPVGPAHAVPQQRNITRFNR